MVQAPSGAPLHAKCVDDADVDAVVEQAAKAACEILDELLSQYGPAETKGTGYVTIKCGNCPKAVAKAACPESPWWLSKARNQPR